MQLLFSVNSLVRTLKEIPIIAVLVKTTTVVVSTGMAIIVTTTHTVTVCIVVTSLVLTPCFKCYLIRYRSNIDTNTKKITPEVFASLHCIY